MRQPWKPAAGLALGAALAIGVVGLIDARGQQPPGVPLPANAQRPPAAGDQQTPPARRELMQALAARAGVTPAELRRATQERGGLIPALESFGLTRADVLDVLTEQAYRRLEPAVSEGRLTQQQAEQLARQQARRLLRRLGGQSQR